MPRYKLVNDKKIQYTEEEEALADAEAKAWADGQAERDAKKYQRDRAVAYPLIADQLDDLYHNGIDGWKKTIKAIKDKYPKD